MRLSLLESGRVAALIAGAAAIAAVASPARADIVGRLECNISGGVGAIIGSQRAVACTFRSNVGPTELYNGVISRLGVDIGQITAGTLTYDVVEAGQAGPGALQGDYIGPGFGITLGTGGGLNALVGGNANAITLQPISATTSTGLNINAGIGSLHLAFAGAEGPRMRHRRHRGHVIHTMHRAHGVHHHRHMR